MELNKKINRRLDVQHAHQHHQHYKMHMNNPPKFSQEYSLALLPDRHWN